MASFGAKNTKDAVAAQRKKNKSGQTVTKGTGPKYETTGTTDTGGTPKTETGGGEGTGGTGTPPGGSPVGGAETLANQAQTRFGKSIAPTAYGTAWANPEAVIRQWFNANKLATDTGYEAMAQELQPSLGIQFMAANNRAGTEPSDFDTGHYLDFVDTMLREGGRSGGGTLGVSDMINALLNPQSQTMKDHLANSALTPSDQVTNMLSSARYGLQPNLPTPVLNALLNQINDQGKDYQAGMLVHPDQKGNFGDLLRTAGIMG